MNSLAQFKTDIQAERVVTLTSLGTFIHWFDFYVLLFLLPVIFENHIHFGLLSGLTLSLIALLIGFIVRPLAAFYFGAEIDKHGRKNYFTLSLSISALSTLTSALFPYSITPPLVGLIVLLFCRTLQGVALSIEYGSALCYISEFVPSQKNGYLTSIIQATAVCAMLFALIVLFSFEQLFGSIAFNEWGWRIPLMLGLPLIWIAKQIRTQLPESTQFVELKKNNKILLHPLKELFQKKQHLMNLCSSAFGVTAPQGVIFYFTHFYFYQLLNNALHLGKTTSSFILISAMLIGWPFIIISGRLSDLFTSRKVLLYSFMASIAIISMTSFEFQQFDASQSKLTLFLFLLASLICSYFVYGSTGAFLTEKFPVEVRGSGISISYHVGNGFFGGFIVVIGEMSAAQLSSIPMITILTVSVIALGLIIFFVTNKVTNTQDSL